MKKTGITRRIDELGRIVIPKEIRKNLHIKCGEFMDIYIDENDVISLKKHSFIDENNRFLSNFVNFLSKKISCNVFLTDQNKVLYSNKEELNNIDLNKYIDLNQNKTKLKLTDNYEINNEYDIYSLRPNGDLIGYLIIEYTQNKCEDDLIKFSTAFLEKHFES